VHALLGWAGLCHVLCCALVCCGVLCVTCCAQYYRITDAQLAVYNIQNLPDAIELLTQTTLRDLVAHMTLDDTFSSREQDNVCVLLALLLPQYQINSLPICRLHCWTSCAPTPRGGECLSFGSKSAISFPLLTSR